MPDLLYQPLGQPAPRAPKPRGRLGGWIIAVCIVAIATAGIAAVLRGRSQPEQSVAAVAQIMPAKPPAPIVATVSPPRQTADKGTLTADEVDQRSGVKVTRPAGSMAGSATIIKVPQDLTVSLQRSPDPRLAEQNRYGLLPKRGRDGAVPLDVYARPVVIDSGLPSDAPRIAIVVGGMGLNPSLTTNAVSELPPAVTLAFAPYGDVLDAQVQAAREAGHEAILQVPMESVGSTAGGAMPHLLMTGDDAKETLDRLHWHMARFTGYVGVANFLGGTFTADSTALGPVLGDVSQRGLMYFDDGTAPRSLAPTLAPGLGLPVVRTDVVLDGGTDAASIDLALTKLERQARDRGVAVGSASGLPLSVKKVAAFARGLAGRGIALVPVSALAASGAQPSRAALP